MSEDVTPDAAEFRCLVPFPDNSQSFVHGFEAGMIWQQMVDGIQEIEPLVGLHGENIEVFRRMASAQGYDFDSEDCGGGWHTAKFTKRRHRFTVISSPTNAERN